VRLYIKILCVVLVVLLIYVPVSAAFVEEIDEDNLNQYSDMNINWAAEYIAKLSFIGVINGYAENVNGSQVKLFKQFGNVKVSEFIKMALCSMGSRVEYFHRNCNGSDAVIVLLKITWPSMGICL
jgi:hypothetical protein